MSIKINWNKLALLPGDEDKLFEEFCFHIAVRKFGEYGTVSYFYNTPGSEFYIELNKPLEHAGKLYSAGDVIGWQAKYWKGAKDDENSPLDANHIKELVKGFETTITYRPKTKLWIVCSPGCFVQAQWDKLIKQLTDRKTDCSFESWNKNVFETFYLDNIQAFNSIFQYFFGANFIGKKYLDDISSDTLSCLNTKFDIDLHTPSDFEQILLSIVDENIAKKLISDKITSLYNHSIDDQKKPIFVGFAWENKYLTENFKEKYVEDLEDRYKIIKELYGSLGKPIYEYVQKAFIALNEYRSRRIERVALLNSENKLMRKASKTNNVNIDYYLSGLANRINELEKQLTGGKENDKNDVYSLFALLIQKDFSIFAEAGYGKTHFACSIVNNMMKRELPVLFFTGSKFRVCDSSESKLIELLNFPTGSNINDVLDTLDFIGEIYQCKLPIVIDGLNESAPYESRWKEELPPLRRKIREKSHLLFITTCREKDEYINVIYGCNNYKEVENCIHLPGIAEKNLNNATARYFKKYEICPINHAIHSSFNNPLLLKIFCITNRGRHDFELNDYSLTSCIKNYSEQIIDAIATDSDGKRNKIRRCQIENNLSKIAQLIWERNTRRLSFYHDFASLFGNDTEKFLDEGMCFLLDRDGNEEQIQFSYDMVAGYHIAKYILEQCNNETEFCNYIERYRERLYGQDRHTLAEDISKNLFYLVPQKYGKEWFELMPNENVIISSLDHLDIIISSQSGKKALEALVEMEAHSSAIKEKICKSLFRRIVEQSNLQSLSLFTPFFIKLDTKEVDLYWNSKFVEYGILEHIYSLLSDKYWSKRYNIEDKITLIALLCGITDTEYRRKFHFQLLYLVEQDLNCLDICQKFLSIRDFFIFESIISIIAGVGLRSNDLLIVDQCIIILEKYLINYTSNHIVLLDNLETLYKYREIVFKQSYNRDLLCKNYEEKWSNLEADEQSFYPIFDYDFDKYNIRPLYEYSYKHTPHFKSKEIYGMLMARIHELGYDGNFYADIQNREYENVKYRRDIRCTYAHKYGRHALMELYGWMMLHSFVENEFKETFRSNIIDIDPSQPQFSPLRSLVTQSFMPHKLQDLPEWIKSSSILFMKQLLVKKLPRSKEEWVLIRGYYAQNIENRYANLYMSVTSQLVSTDMDENKIQNLYLHDAISYSHAFAGELGWRTFEFTEENEEDSLYPALMAQYSFSNWDSTRFKYKDFYCLNTEIAKRIGLIFDIKTMAYYLNGEKVSEHYINESDHFFYIRKDVIDSILEIYNAKMRQHIYERRIISSNVPKDIPEILTKFVQNEIDVFYQRN